MTVGVERGAAGAQRGGAGVAGADCGECGGVGIIENRMKTADLEAKVEVVRYVVSFEEILTKGRGCMAYEQR